MTAMVILRCPRCPTCPKGNIAKYMSNLKPVILWTPAKKNRVLCVLSLLLWRGRDTEDTRETEGVLAQASGKLIVKERDATVRTPGHQGHAKIVRLRK